MKEDVDNIYKKIKIIMICLLSLSFVNFFYGLVNCLENFTTSSTVMIIIYAIPMYTSISSIIVLAKKRNANVLIKITCLLSIMLSIGYLSGKVHILKYIMTILNIVFSILGLYYCDKLKEEWMKIKKKTTHINNEYSSVPKEEQLIEFDERFEKLIEQYKKETEKECYSIYCMYGEPTIMDNKIGGKPYLPKGELYPTNKNGESMPLLIQINLKDIDLENWPRKGILEIFTDREVFGSDEYIIKYFEEGLEYQENFPEIDLSDFVIEEPIKIGIKKEICNMPLSDYRANNIICKIFNEIYEENVNTFNDIKNVFGTYEWYSNVYKRIENPRANIGGYADFTQTDPREHNENENRTECLVKIDSMLDNRLNIGDSGIIFSFISVDDLKSCNFQNAYYGEDCC